MVSRKFFWLLFILRPFFRNENSPGNRTIDDIKCSLEIAAIDRRPALIYNMRMQKISQTEIESNASEIVSQTVGLARDALRRGDLDGALDFFSSLAAYDSPAARYIAYSKRGAKELCSELLREAAFCEILGPAGRAIPAFGCDKIDFNDGGLTRRMEELIQTADREIRKAPAAAEKLFYLEGLAGVLASDRNGAIRSLKCAGLLFSAASKGSLAPALYDAILSILYFTGPDASRLGSISDVGEDGRAKLAIDKPHISFIYEILLAGLSSAPRERKPENKPQFRTEITRYSDGKVKSEARYAGAELDGISKRYNAAGKLIERSQWKNGHPVHCVYFAADGSPLEGKKSFAAEAYGGAIETMEGTFTGGQPDGVVKCYLTPKGGKKTLYCEKSFKKGRPHGEFRYFAEGGQTAVTTRRIYRDGEIVETVEYERRDGGRETRMYFKNGAAARVESRVKGALVYERDYGGPDEVVYEKIYTRGDNEILYLSELKSYLGSEAHGIFYEYGPRGEIRTAVPYKNGVISGLFKKYHSNGNIALIHSCHDDEYEPLAAKFDENAGLISVRLFDFEWSAQ